MSNKQKNVYLSPEVEMADSQCQTLVCQSGLTEGYININDPSWGLK